MKQMQFKFINQNSTYYKDAVTLRVTLFFNKMNSQEALINDNYESTALHLICIDKNDTVIGTGRLNIENEIGLISQMAIDDKFQKKGIGKEIMTILINQCITLKVSAINLSARETAIAFYKKFGFDTEGEIYPSKKTGILHQNMTKFIG